MSNINTLYLNNMSFEMDSSTTVTTSYTRDSNISIGGCTSQNNLETFRFGVSCGKKKVPFLLAAVEHYTLCPETSKTLGGYIINKFNFANRLPLNFNMGIMYGINKFKPEKDSSYFNFTRNDRYIKVGLSTNIDIIEEVYTGVEQWINGQSKVLLKFGAKNVGNKFVPAIGLEYSFDQEFILNKNEVTTPEKS